MARFIVFLLLLVPVVHAGLWLAERPGSFAVTWLGWQAEISMTLLAVGLALVAVICMVVGMVVWAISRLPKQRALETELARTKQGLSQLNTALIATRSQDYGPAQRALLKAGKCLPDSPLPHLIGLQLSVRHGAEADTRTHLSALRAHHDTAPLALHQLVRDAFARNAYEEAASLLDEASEHAPKAVWVHAERVRLATRTGNAAALLEELARVSFRHQLAAHERRKLRAQLHTIKKDYALALRVLPHFAPAALGYAADNAVSEDKAIAALFTAWKVQPATPILAAMFARSTKLNEKALLKRAKRFAHAAKHTAEAEDALAIAYETTNALDNALAHAKRAMEHAATPDRFERIASILAKRDGAEAANPWLKQALDASHDDYWACGSCGTRHDAWHMECTHCSMLGHIGWGRHARNQAQEVAVVQAA